MNVYAIASSAVSALGFNINDHWKAVTSGQTGIRRHEDLALSNTPFFASKLDAAQWQYIETHTRGQLALSPFEQLAIFTSRKAMHDCEHDFSGNDTVFILSTTKGNIELLGQVPDERVSLYYSADIIAKQLGIQTPSQVVSHACASGVMALVYGLRLLQAGKYKHAIVTGCDRFSQFVLSGFQSFQAIADAPCRPYDADRKGINLGEAASTIILSANNNEEAIGQLIAGATSNDANHISGPSRTGAELALAINRALEEAGISPRQIGMISAHGTATLYNDEMEAKAFDAAGVLNSPLHSFKGYIGHTLGTAGVIESAMVLESIHRQQLIPSMGFENIGVPKAVNVTRTLQPADIDYVLKTASGFGGCNAAIVWKRS